MTPVLSPSLMDINITMKPLKAITGQLVLLAKFPEEKWVFMRRAENERGDKKQISFNVSSLRLFPF